MLATPMHEFAKMATLSDKKIYKCYNQISIKMQLKYFSTAKVFIRNDA